MAKLESDGLTLEIKFNSYKDEWLNYDIKFYWKDDLIVNDSIFKRDGEYWKNRSFGTFLANDYKRDCLIRTIRKVLKNNSPDYWEPIEPDIKVAIYPDMYFPFLKDKWILIEDGEIKQKEEKDLKNPDDLFTIITFIDAYNFKNCGAYSGSGISLHQIINRSDLEKFVDELEKEYSNLEI